MLSECMERGIHPFFPSCLCFASRVENVPVKRRATVDFRGKTPREPPPPAAKGLTAALTWRPPPQLFFISAVFIASDWISGKGVITVDGVRVHVNLHQIRMCVFPSSLAMLTLYFLAESSRPSFSPAGITSGWSIWIKAGEEAAH